MTELVLYRKNKDGRFYVAWKFKLDERQEKLELDGKVIAGGLPIDEPVKVPNV